jgi:ubiquitin-conjugating enzyme (huntingtin interacting protein 2)
MLQSLLSTPEPKDPQDAEVAAMLLKNPAEFNHKAREWAIKHAGAPRSDEGQGSGGATSESLKSLQKIAKTKESKAQLQEYVFLAIILYFDNILIFISDIAGIIEI